MIVIEQASEVWRSVFDSFEEAIAPGAAQSKRNASSTGDGDSRSAHRIASPHLTAFILLAVNTGIGNTDIALMEHKHIDLDGGWLDYPRGKTGSTKTGKALAGDLRRDT